MSALVSGVRAFLSAQFLRFAIVGVVSNALLYLVYLGMTYNDIGPKLAASVTYAAGVMQTFWANRAWSFAYRGSVPRAFVRYVGVYAAGYLLNMLALFLLVDCVGLDHRWVQAALIIVLACFTFFSLRFWAFQLHHASGAKFP